MPDTMDATKPPGYAPASELRRVQCLPFVSSQQVAQLVEQLADKLGFERFSLMGFSFGGILTMRIFKRLPVRVDRVVLIAPCLDHRALSFSSFQVSLLHRLNQLLSVPKIQKGFYSLIHNEYAVPAVVKLLQKIGRLEKTVPLEKKLLQTSENTISVLNAQINEILTTEFEVTATKHQTPCYFAMSIYDPLLSFDTTLQIVHDHFENVSTMPLLYPIHQPPGAFTYDDLNKNFYKTVNMFIGANA